MTYDDARSQGYDCPPPGWERRRQVERQCDDGMCGALDCPRCQPESRDASDDRDEKEEPWTDPSCA